MKFSPSFKLLPALFSLRVLSICAQNPVSGWQEFVAISESDEVLMGRKSDTAGEPQASQTLKIVQ